MTITLVERARRLWVETGHPDAAYLHQALLSESGPTCSKCGRTPPFPGGTRCQDLQCPLINWSHDKADQPVAELLTANEKVVEQYVKDYEALMEDEDGHEGYHQPTDEERYLIEDAIHGLLADDAFVRTFNAWQDAVRSVRSATRRIKYIVRAGGECPQDWLCEDIPEVQAALSAALYGDPKSMDDHAIHDIGRYLQQIQRGMAVSNELKWSFEDGWVQVIKLCTPDRSAK